MKGFRRDLELFSALTLRMTTSRVKFLVSNGDDIKSHSVMKKGGQCDADILPGPFAVLFSGGLQQYVDQIVLHSQLHCSFKILPYCTFRKFSCCKPSVYSEVIKHTLCISLSIVPLYNCLHCFVCLSLFHLSPRLRPLFFLPLILRLVQSLLKLSLIIN